MTTDTISYRSNRQPPAPEQSLIDADYIIRQPPHSPAPGRKHDDGEGKRRARPASSSTRSSRRRRRQSLRQDGGASTCANQPAPVTVRQSTASTCGDDCSMGMHSRRRLLSEGADGPAAAPTGAGAPAGYGTTGSSGLPSPPPSPPSTLLLTRIKGLVGRRRAVVTLLLALVVPLGLLTTAGFATLHTTSVAHDTDYSMASLRDAGSCLFLRWSWSWGWGGGVDEEEANSRSAESGCRTFFATCPRGYHGKQDPRRDVQGNAPLTCRRTKAPPAGPGSGVHVFQVTVCKGAAQLSLTVDHVHGFVDTAANRRWETGPDLIEASIVGPELRVVPLVNTNGSLYEAAIGAVLPGNYTVDVTVVLTPYMEAETAGIPQEQWPFQFVRNLVLTANEAWVPAVASPAELEKDAATSRAMADGRWVRLLGVDGYPDARSDMAMPKDRKGKWNGYRCQHAGEYAWTPRAGQASASWERFADREQIYECLRKAKPATSKNGFTRLVMYGDSQSRTTFNGLLNLLFPEDSRMRARKDFKSTTESQCFGGKYQGFEVCFQWNAWACDRPHIEPLLESFDFMTVNIGQWMLACPACDFGNWTRVVDPGIRSMAQLHHELAARGEGRRLRWLQTSLMPTTNADIQVKLRNRRQHSAMLHVNNHTDRLLEELRMPQLRTQGIQLPFHDCTEDMAHFHFGLPETVVKEKILPWLCPEEGE